MITKQEMFNRAYLGLASQGFVRCRNDLGNCVYANAINGKEAHCAWGWVDKSLKSYETDDVVSLSGRGIGLAANLTGDELRFALGLQSIHDRYGLPHEMRAELIRLAQQHNLTVPEVP